MRTFPLYVDSVGWVWCRDDVMGRKLWRGASIEKEEMELVANIVAESKVFFDIGANQGLFSIMVSQRTKQKTQVHAFEPSTRDRAMLDRNVRLNRLRNVHVHPYALGSQASDCATLHVVNGSETGCNSLRPPASDAGSDLTVETVSVRTLDEFIAKNNTVPDVIKMDVEGAELDVLQGATRLLSAARKPIWLVEVADKRTKPWGYDSVRILECFHVHQYCLYSVGIKVLNRISPCDSKHSLNVLALPENLDERVRVSLSVKGWVVL